MNNLRLCHHTILLIGLIPFWLSAQVSVHISAETTVSAKETDITVSGDWNNHGTLDWAASRLIFNGSEDQILSDSAGNILPQMVVHKSGGSLYLADTVRISDSLNLVSGKVISADSSLLLLLTMAGCNPTDSSSFVDGPMAKVYPVATQPNSFQFPTGKDNDFRPVTVYLTSVSADSVTINVEQVNSSAQALAGIMNEMDKVSSVRYWYISKEGPGTFRDAYITLSYDTLATNDGVEIASELRVAQLDTTDTWTWNNAGGSGTQDYVGTIRTDALDETKLGYFTFGDAAGGLDISLPVMLSLFEITENRDEIRLFWRTESEVNNHYWLIDKKEAGDSTLAFETIAKIDGQGTVSSESDYHFVDKEIAAGNSYVYRLADVSFSGRTHYHDPVTIEVSSPGKYELYQNFPNPFNPLTHILYDIPWDSEVTVEIYNLVGQKVAQLVTENQVAGYYKLIWDGRNQQGRQVASGLYLLCLRADGMNDGKKERFVQVKKMMLLR